MFSPEASTNNAGTLRGTRRRRQNGSEGPRKRSKIRDDAPTIEIPSTLPVREKRQSSYTQRASHSEDGTTLTQCSRYSVHKLAAPDRVRASSFGPFRAELRCPKASNFAIAVTREQVFVWDYVNGVNGAPERLLNLPQPIKSTDIAPIGYLVASNSTTDVGLIIAQSTAGKISYWENIDSLEPGTLLQHRQQVVEGSISGMLRGDVIETIQEAHHAGYVLLFKSGCLAHLTIRDAQGKPKIHVGWLEGPSNRGWLSGLAHSLGRGWKQTLAAVKTRTSVTKGNVEVIAATGEGVFKTWEISWTNNDNFIREFNASEEIKQALASVGVADPKAKEEVKLVDFELMGATNELASARHVEGLTVLALIAVETPTLRKYALVELTMTPEVVQPRKVVPITVHEGFVTSASSELAKLLLPEPQHSAFVVFDHAVVVVSIATPVQQETAEDQLFAEQDAASTQLAAFQDVIHLRQGAGANIIQCSVESQTSTKNISGSIVVCTKLEGLLRFTATAPWDISRKAERSETMPYLKIAQAVIYGDEKNVLDLNNIAGLAYTETQVEEAVIRVSRNIIRTEIEGIPKWSANVRDHIVLRLRYLQRLADHLRKFYPPLSRRIKWILLSDAERMASALGVWDVSEAHSTQHDMKQGSLLQHLINAIDDAHKTAPSPELENTDRIRHFFIKDLRNLDKVLNNVAMVITAFYENKLSPYEDIMTYMSEGNEITCTLIRSAWDFRTKNLAAYELQDEQLENGILVTGYKDLPEFWTSRQTSMNAMRELSRNFHKIIEAGDKQGHSLQKAVGEIAKEQPQLVLTTCLMHIERYRWLLEQSDPSEQRAGRDVKALFDKQVRGSLITSLAEVGLAQKGMEIAEKLHDVQTLVELLIDEQSYHEEAAYSAEERQQAQHVLKSLEKQTQGYFDRLGEDFANAYYKAQIKNHRLGYLLNNSFGKQEQLTKFLRSDSSYEKLSWINDATNEKSVKAASATLMKLATDHEQSSWAKKIELSIARLGLLAVEEDTNKASQKKSLTSAKATRDLLEENRKQTIVNNIQERLFAHIKPNVVAALDEDSVVDNVFATFGEARTKKRPALDMLLRQGFQQVIEHRDMSPDMLIEVLSLMEPAADEANPDNLAGQEFCLALQVLQNSKLEDDLQKPGTLGDVMSKLLWKRLFVRQDWGNINKTGGRSDTQQDGVLENTPLFETIKAGALAKLTLDIPTASECITAGSTPESLSIRFPDTTIASAIAIDNTLDDMPLQEAIKKHDIERWIIAIRELAKKKAKLEARAYLEGEKRFDEYFKGFHAPVIRNEVDLKGWLRTSDLEAAERQVEDIEVVEDGADVEGEMIIDE